VLFEVPEAPVSVAAPMRLTHFLRPIKNLDPFHLINVGYRCGS